MSETADRQDPEYKKVMYDHGMRLWEGRLIPYAAHLGVIGTFASLAINSVILANSAAAGTVLAFLASMWSDKASVNEVLPDALSVLRVFVWGMFSAMVSGAFSYVAQWCLMQAEMADEGSKFAAWMEKIGIGAQVVAVTAAGVGICAFIFGATKALDALAAVGSAASIS